MADDLADEARAIADWIKASFVGRSRFALLVACMFVVVDTIIGAAETLEAAEAGAAAVAGDLARNVRDCWTDDTGGAAPPCGHA